LTYQDFQKKKIRILRRTWGFEMGEVGGVGTEDMNLREKEKGRNGKGI
jgi:hypothetical protein